MMRAARNRFLNSMPKTSNVFARYLNTGESTVRKGEAGQKRPGGMALRLLGAVEKHGLEVLV